MTLTKKENKEIKDQVDKIRNSFFDSVWDIVDDMYFSDMKKQEITKILIRDLKMAIDVSFDDLEGNL